MGGGTGARLKYRDLAKRLLGDTRGGRVRLSVLTGAIAKGALVLTGLVFTPLVVRYLGKEGYGLYVTITAVVSWLQISSFGVGAGLQNSLTEAVAAEDTSRQRALVSTAFFFLSGVAVLLICAALVTLPFIRWEQVFRVTEGRYSRELAPAFAIVVAGFISTVALTFVSAIYAARQELYVPNLLALVNSMFNIAALLFVILYDLGLIGITAATIGSGVILSWAFAAWYLFRPQMRALRPSARWVSHAAWRRIWRSSAAFFIIEICAIILFQTDSFIITRFLRVEDVAPYNIAAKPFTLVSVLILSVVAHPLWAAYGNAKAAGDFAWIRRNHRRVLVSFMSAFGVVLLLMVPFGQPLLTLWVGAAAAPDTALVLLTGCYYLVRQWTDLHASLVNGLDMMWPQAFSASIHAIVTITLEILLIQRFGLIGVPIGCLLGYLLVSAWFLPLLASRSLTRLESERTTSI